MHNIVIESTPINIQQQELNHTGNQVANGSLTYTCDHKGNRISDCKTNTLEIII